MYTPPMYAGAYVNPWQAMERDDYSWLATGDQIASIVGGTCAVLSVVLSIIALRGQNNGGSPPSEGGRYKLPKFATTLALVGILFGRCQLLRVTASNAAVLGSSGSNQVAVFAIAAGLMVIVVYLRQPVALDRVARGLIKSQHVERSYRFAGMHEPALTKLYVEQRASAGPTSSKAGHESAQLTYSDVLQKLRHAVVVGGPGGGKSTLAKRVVDESSAWWTNARLYDLHLRQSDHRARICIFLPARLLIGRAILDALRFRTMESGLEVPPDYFNKSPLPGTRWLIVIDGLDEIRDSDERSAVLHRLSEFASTPMVAHQLLLTTRPLTTGELEDLRVNGVDEYSLLQFTNEDVLTLARNWFTARSASVSPGRAVDAFVRQARSARIIASRAASPSRRRFSRPALSATASWTSLNTSHRGVYTGLGGRGVGFPKGLSRGR